MNNAYNFGITLQKPLNWGLDQFNSENKMVQHDAIAKPPESASSVEVRSKTSNVALKALKALGAVLVIVFTSLAYALGALFKFFSKQSKEASTTDQVAQNALKKSTSSSTSSRDSSVSDNPSEVVEQRFLHETEDFQELITELKDLSICKRVNIAELEMMVTPFLSDEMCRYVLFMIFERIEAGIIHTRDSSAFSGVDKNEIISMDEMKDFLVKHFGIGGYFRTYTLLGIFDSSCNVEFNAKNAALLAVLEKLLQSGLGQEDLKLVNMLTKFNYLRLNSVLVFRNEELYYDFENEVTISNLFKNMADQFGDDGPLFNKYVSDYTQKIFDAIVKGSAVHADDQSESVLSGTPENSVIFEENNSSESEKSTNESSILSGENFPVGNRGKEFNPVSEDFAGILISQDTFSKKDVIDALYLCTSVEETRLSITAEIKSDVKRSELASIVLKYKIDPNKDSPRGIPLFQCTNIEQVSVLLAMGANPNSTIGGLPLLRIYEQYTVVCLLIEAGADIHAKTNEGNTLLHTCTIPEIARLFLQKGVDPQISNNQGKNAIEFLNESKRDDIVKEIENFQNSKN